MRLLSHWLAYFLLLFVTVMSVILCCIIVSNRQSFKAQSDIKTVAYQFYVSFFVCFTCHCHY